MSKTVSNDGYTNKSLQIIQEMIGFQKKWQIPRGKILHLVDNGKVHAGVVF